MAQVLLLIIFNDDSLGRCLDEINGYGITMLFCEIAFEVCSEQKLLGKNANIDTTSLTVFGDYEEAEEAEIIEAAVGAIGTEVVESKDDAAAKQVSTDVAEPKASESTVKDQSQECPELPKNPVPKYGFSKQHRPDLKQMILNIATTGAAGMPCWMEAHSGNASDKIILHEASKRMQTFCKTLKDAPSFMTIGDSAIYDACVKDAGEMLWLTRMPETHSFAKELVQRSDKEFCWIALPDDYKICVVESRYKKVHQRFAVMYSQHAFDKEIKTLERDIKKTEVELTKSLGHLGTQVFKCETDAERELRRFKEARADRSINDDNDAVFDGLCICSI